MSEHRYSMRISESCVDPNPLMVERQDPDNFTRFQTRKRCALEIAAYVFNKCLYVQLIDNLVKTDIVYNSFPSIDKNSRSAKMGMLF